MSCHIVGAHQHQRRKRLKRKRLTLVSYGEWAVKKFMTSLPSATFVSPGGKP